MLDILRLRTGPDARAQRRTALTAGSAILLLAAACAAVGSAHIAADIRSDTGTAALQAARDMADRLSAGMAARVREVELLSQLDLFRSGTASRPTMRRTLEQLGNGLPAYAWIGLIDGEGKVLAGTAGVLEDQSIAQRPVFRMGRLGTWTGDVHDAVMLAAIAPHRPGESVKFVDVAAPVRSTDGRLRGVLALHLSWQWAAKVREAVLKARGAAPSLRLQVLGPDGSVLLGPAQTDARPVAAPTLPLATVRDLQDGWRTVRWNDGSDAVTAVAPSHASGNFQGFGWRVVARDDPAATDAAIASAERRIWRWSLGLGAGFAALVGRLLGSDVLPGSTRRRAERTPPRTERRTETVDIGAAVAGLRASMADGDAAAGDGTHRAGDALTGLPTRTHLGRLARELERGPAAHSLELCVLCLDLDDFRAVNDRLGRAAGDAALRLVAERMQAAARADDLVLRLGGDEFVFIAPCAAGRGAATTALIATRLFEQLQRPFDVTGTAGVALGGCIGTARWLPGGPPLTETIAQAGEALLAAKRAGRRQLRHYASRRSSRPARSTARAA